MLLRPEKSAELMVHLARMHNLPYLVNGISRPNYFQEIEPIRERQADARGEVGGGGIDWSKENFDSFYFIVGQSSRSILPWRLLLASDDTRLAKSPPSLGLILS